MYSICGLLLDTQWLRLHSSIKRLNFKTPYFTYQINKQIAALSISVIVISTCQPPIKPDVLQSTYFRII